MKEREVPIGLRAIECGLYWPYTIFRYELVFEDYREKVSVLVVVFFFFCKFIPQYYDGMK